MDYIIKTYDGKAWRDLLSTLKLISEFGEGLQLIEKIASLKKATQNELGGIKLGYVETENNYPVKIDANGNAYVHVPTKYGNLIAISEEQMDAIVQNDNNLGQVAHYIGETGKYNKNSYYLIEDDN